MKTHLLCSLGLACIIALTACGKKATVTESEVQGAKGSAPVDDITRPPKVVVDSSDEVTELDPDETISFDKWQKQQAEDDKGNKDE